MEKTLPTNDSPTDHFLCHSVGNIITDGICVLHRRKNFVGKTIKSYSDYLQKSNVDHARNYKENQILNKNSCF